MKKLKNRIWALLAAVIMGDLPRVELFARQETEGWQVWGNEVISGIAL